MKIKIKKDESVNSVMNRYNNLNVFDYLDTILELNGNRLIKAVDLLYLGDSHYNMSHKAFGKNTIPSQYLLNNILPTVNFAEMIFADLGISKNWRDLIRLSSIFRNEEYNHKVGGGTFSKHKVFNAIDLVCIDRDKLHPDDLINSAMVLRSSGMFTGGVGGYDWGVHIDTDKLNRTWDFRTVKK